MSVFFRLPFTFQASWSSIFVAQVMCFTPCLNDCIRFDECIMWCTQVIRGLISKGDFFQWRTLTRTGFFHSWAKSMPRFSGIRVKGKGFRIRVKKLIPVQFFLPSRNIKSENASLPVDVSRSKNGVRQYLPGHSPLLPFFFTISWVYCYFLDIATLNKCELRMIHKYEYALNASS